MELLLIILSALICAYIGGKAISQLKDDDIGDLKLPTDDRIELEYLYYYDGILRGEWQQTNAAGKQHLEHLASKGGLKGLQFMKNPKYKK